MKTTLTLLLLCALFSEALGQVERVDKPWPAGLAPNGVFGKVVAGQVSSDQILDAVILKGGVPVFSYGTAQYNSFSEIESTAVADVEILKGGSPDGRDLIVTVDAAGLETFSLADQATTFNRRFLKGGAWRQVRQLRVGQIEGTTTNVLAGLEVTGASLQILTSAATGGAPFVEGPSIVFNNQVIDFVVAQWDSDPLPEFVGLTVAGLEVRDDDGSHLATLASNLTGTLIARFRQAGDAHDRIAWVELGSDGSTHFLTVADQLGVEPRLDVGMLGAVGLVSAGVAPTGHDDLIFSGTAAHYLLVLFNQTGLPGATATFGTHPGGFLFLETKDQPNDPATGTQAVPAVADFDHDGDTDLLFPVDSVAKLTLSFNLLEDANAQVPNLVNILHFNADEYDFVSGGFAGSGTPSSEPSGQAVLEFELADNPNAPANATHIDLVVWRQDLLAADVASTAVQHATVALPVAWPVFIPMLIDELEHPFDAVYSAELRYIRLDPADSLLETYPTRSGRYATLQPDLDALLLLSGATEYHHVLMYAELDSGTLPSSAEVGGFVEPLDIPDFVDGSIPAPGPSSP